MPQSYQPNPPPVSYRRRATGTSARPISQAPREVPGRATATGKRPRWRWIEKFTRAGPAVLAGLPQTGARGAGSQPAVTVPQSVQAPGSNARPQFRYSFSRPAPRLGPTPRLAPGTGSRDPLTGLPARQGNARLGVTPQGYSSQQYFDYHQFDYTPPTDPSYDLGQASNSFVALPRQIPDSFVDGRELVSSYAPHDSTPADRFFKSGRSSGPWQDQTFGPGFRWLQTQQQVARYNLYTDLQLARQPSPNSYFLPYTTPPSVASQFRGQSGVSAPLGYGAH